MRKEISIGMGERAEISPMAPYASGGYAWRYGQPPYQYGSVRKESSFPVRASSVTHPRCRKVGESTPGGVPGPNIGHMSAATATT